MRNKAVFVGAAALCVAAVLAGLALHRGPSAAYAQGQAAGMNNGPPELKKGVSVVFDMPKHPFVGEEFEKVPAAVEEVKGHWVRITQAIKKDFQETLKKKEVTVWVNFNTVNWYGVLP
jgi:hypothetical protein